MAEAQTSYAQSDAFSNTSAFLGNTFNRMNHMARRQGGWWCNMMMFLVLVIWLFVSVTSCLVVYAVTC
jgi:hypothetical protein